jgi:hypothetical protein
MSRRKSVDNSASVSLFPFLAVLLCTMGALLVVLVAVSRTARNAALDEAQARKQAAKQSDPAITEKLKQIAQHMTKLKQVRAQAEKKLREDQLRLTQLENHMRRMQDELQKLVHATMELEALEGDHYDDRRQAERERDRLKQLIANKKAEIEDLKKSAGSRKRTYSLVPYEGPNGTTRRPIIIECCKDGLILQPEGVVVHPHDLQPPLGAGNALACAIRAARDHYIQQHPQEGANQDTEPYPMLIIRPDGAEHFGLARRAIEAADFDFGYEPVEQHWELNYGLPDPVLANIEQQALEQARVRQEALAAAAPRAYRDPNLGASGRFEYDADPVDSFGNPIPIGGRGGSGIGSRPTLPTAAGPNAATAGGTSNQDSGDRYAANTSGDGTGAGGPDSGGTNLGSDDTANGAENANGPVGGGPSPQGMAASQGSSAGSSGNSSEPSASQMSEQGSGFSSVATRDREVSPGGTPNDINVEHREDSEQQVAVTPSWSAKRQHVRAVAVRRTIRVVVRHDQIGLMSDESADSRKNLAGKTIPLKGDTIESVNEFIKEVEKQVDSWGIAGDNLYWRPVLEIQVGPDGQQRAEDLARLLKRSEIEVQFPATATNTSQGVPSATR